MTDNLLYAIAALLLAMSVVLFIMMGNDKSRAKRSSRRIPEKRLFLFAIFGGAIGGCCGMYAFRHKTKHLSFAIGFLLIALAQLATYIFLWTLK